jgi:hypothetical protein
MRNVFVRFFDKTVFTSFLSLALFLNGCGFLNEQFNLTKIASEVTLLPLEISPSNLETLGSSPAQFTLKGASGQTTSQFSNCSLCSLNEDMTFTPPWFTESNVTLKISDSLQRSITASIKLNPRVVQFGSTGEDATRAIEVGTDGSLYVLGQTNSTSFGGQTNNGGYDLFLTKFDKYGRVIWTRLFGTSSDEYTETHRMVFDESGNVIFGGITLGSFPTYTNPGGGWSGFDLFLVKVTPSGDTVWLKQYPLVNDTVIYNMARDSTPYFYVSGWTKATLLGQAQVGDPSGYVAKYDMDGVMQDVVMVGHSSGGTVPRGLTVSSSGIYVVGYTNGSLPGFTNVGNYDGFAEKLDTDLNIIWRYQFGSTAGDYPFGNIAVDETNNALYFTGYTSGTLASQTSQGGDDLIAVKLNTNTGAMIWTQQWGTSQRDQCNSGLTLDLQGQPILMTSTDGAYSGQTSKGGSDLAIIKLSASDGTMTLVNQIGTSQNEYERTISFQSDFFWSGGWTNDTMPWALNSNAGLNDMLVVKFNSNLDLQ